VGVPNRQPLPPRLEEEVENVILDVDLVPDEIQKRYFQSDI
jgi:hypothetical protein